MPPRQLMFLCNDEDYSFCPEPLCDNVCLGFDNSLLCPIPNELDKIKMDYCLDFESDHFFDIMVDLAGYYRALGDEPPERPLYPMSYLLATSSVVEIAYFFCPFQDFQYMKGAFSVNGQSVKRMYNENDCCENDCSISTSQLLEISQYESHPPYSGGVPIPPLPLSSDNAVRRALSPKRFFMSGKK